MTRTTTTTTTRGTWKLPSPDKVRAMAKALDIRTTGRTTDELRKLINLTLWIGVHGDPLRRQDPPPAGD